MSLLQVVVYHELLIFKCLVIIKVILFQIILFSCKHYDCDFRNVLLYDCHMIHCSILNTPVYQHLSLIYKYIYSFYKTLSTLIFINGLSLKRPCNII